MGSERLEYLCYRCIGCGRLLTKLEIIARWEAAEAAGGVPVSTCVCGSGRIRPGNPTPEEEEKGFSPEQKRRYYVEGIIDEGTKLIDLYEREVKDRNLGPLYGQVAPK